MLTLGSGSRARAEADPLEACVARLDDERTTELLTFTKDSLRDQRLGAALWYSGWVAFNSTIVSIGAWKIVTAPTHLQQDVWLMSSIGAGIFLVGAAILPLPGLYAHRRMSRLPEARPEQRRAKLRKGVQLLVSAAAGEDRNSNLLAHLGALFYGLFSAGFLYFHNPHADNRDVAIAASVQLIATMAGAEATLWSTPRRARRDLASLRGACADPSRKPRASAPLRTFSLAASPAFAGLRLRF